MPSLKSASAQRAAARSAAGVAAQARHVGAFLSTLPAPAFARPTRLPGWDLRLLTAHLVHLQQQMIEDVREGTTARPASTGELMRTIQAHGRRITEHAETIAAEDDGPTLARQLRRNVGELASLVDKEMPDVVASVPPLRMRDHLRLAAIEWVIHSDDINAVFGAQPIPIDAQAQADAVRCLAEVLAQANPGHSIEVRVPPLSAVQCGLPGDPTHTRGTPPNVVEAEPMVFARLASGRVSFADAVGNGLTASGTRADISDMLPLL